MPFPGWSTGMLCSASPSAPSSGASLPSQTHTTLRSCHMYRCVFIFLFVHLYRFLFICIFICVSVYSVSICLWICLPFVYLLICLPEYLLLCLSLYSCFYVFIHLFICWSVCLYLSTSVGVNLIYLSVFPFLFKTWLFFLNGLSLSSHLICVCVCVCNSCHPCTGNFILYVVLMLLNENM